MMFSGRLSDYCYRVLEKVTQKIAFYVIFFYNPVAMAANYAGKHPDWTGS